jgi:hypothetical protein
MDSTFALGILSILQMACLPGAFFAKQLKNETLISKIASIFGLSLVLNYLGVFLLTALQLYQPAVVYSLISAELVLLCWVYRHELLNTRSLPQVPFTSFITSGMLGAFTGPDKPKRFQAIIATFIVFSAFATVAYFMSVLIHCLGTTLSTWDALASWNKWAIEWSNNRIPKHTWHYPQLLPGVWSISFMVLQKETLQLFIKAFMPLFSLLSLLLLLDLGKQRRDLAFFLAVGVTGYLLYRLIQPLMIGIEYADIPAMFMTLLSFCWLLNAQKAADKTNIRQAIILSALFCSGAALCKQSGLYPAILFPLLAYWFSLKGHPLLNFHEKTRLLGLGIFITLLVAGSWYLYKEFQIFQHADTSEIEFILAKAHKKPLPESLSLAFAPIPWGIRILITLALFNSLKTPLGNRIFWLITLPNMLIWAFFFIYDARLVALVFPFVAIGVGLGLRQAMFQLTVWEPPVFPLQKGRYTVRPVVILGIGTLIILVLSNTMFTTRTLVQRNNRELANAVDAKVNAMLYTYQRKYGFTGLIATIYRPMAFLPELKHYYISCKHCYSGRSREQILSNRSIKYILTQRPYFKDMDPFLETGEYKVLMSTQSSLYSYDVKLIKVGD